MRNICKTPALLVSLALFVSGQLTCIIHAQSCSSETSKIASSLHASDDTECRIEQAPACQRIKPASSGPIFIGTVLNIKQSDATAIVDGKCVETYLQTVTLNVKEGFVGDLSGTVTLYAGTINGTFFTKGTFLVFTKRLPDGSLGVTGCGGTTWVGNAKEELAYLRSWKSRPRTGELYGYTFLSPREDAPHMQVAISTPNQSITISGPQQIVFKTDSRGSYRLEGLPPGSYTLQIDSPFYISPDRIQKADVVERGCAEVNFYIQRDRRSDGSHIAIQPVAKKP